MDRFLIPFFIVINIVVIDAVVVVVVVDVVAVVVVVVIVVFINKTSKEYRIKNTAPEVSTYALVLSTCHTFPHTR